MTATGIRLSGSLPAHGPILYDVIFILALRLELVLAYQTAGD